MLCCWRQKKKAREIYTPPFSCAVFDVDPPGVADEEGLLAVVVEAFVALRYFSAGAHTRTVWSSEADTNT